MKCDNCKFFHLKEPTDKEGQCRRFPPTNSLYPSGNQQPVLYDNMTSFPWVSYKDWCGEFVKWQPS
jgi:hypothetical protein